MSEAYCPRDYPSGFVVGAADQVAVRRLVSFRAHGLNGVVPGEDNQRGWFVDDADDDGPVLAEAADGFADLVELAAAGVAWEEGELVDVDVADAEHLNRHDVPPGWLGGDDGAQIPVLGIRQPPANRSSSADECRGWADGGDQVGVGADVAEEIEHGAKVTGARAGSRTVSPPRSRLSHASCVSSRQGWQTMAASLARLGSAGRRLCPVVPAAAPRGQTAGGAGAGLPGCPQTRPASRRTGHDSENKRAGQGRVRRISDGYVRDTGSAGDELRTVGVRGGGEDSGGRVVGHPGEGVRGGRARLSSSSATERRTCWVSVRVAMWGFPPV